MWQLEISLTYGLSRIKISHLILQPFLCFWSHLLRVCYFFDARAKAITNGKSAEFAKGFKASFCKTT